MTVILHISDIHAGSGEFDSYVYRCDEKLAEILRDKGVEYLVCSGDLTFKGQKDGYSKAISFLNNTTKDHSVSTILVPGNHDICKNEAIFESFDIAKDKISENVGGKFSNESCFLFSTPEIDFFLANSAYSGDHTYGEIDLAGLRKAIAASVVGKKRVLISHHPFLAGINDKCSSVINAREVLQVLAVNKFTAILHGHQHMNSRFVYKFRDSEVDVIGIRSLSLTQPDIPTGAQLVYLDETGIRVEQLDLSSDKGLSW